MEFFEYLIIILAGVHWLNWKMLLVVGKLATSNVNHSLSVLLIDMIVEVLFFGVAHFREPFWDLIFFNGFLNKQITSH